MDRHSNDGPATRRRGKTAIPTGRVLACLLLLVLAPGGPLAAQSADTASVLGTIVDAQGGVLPGVAVTATNADTGVVRTDVTAANGTYRLRAVPPGRYEISAELQGFRTTVRKGIELAVGAEAAVDFTLEVAGVSEALTVEANVSVVDTTTATVGANLGTKQLELLPTISRDYRDFLRVVSGTSSTSEGVAFFGARAASNNWQIDGVDNTENASGKQRSSPQIDSIAEFQVLTNNFKAEYGHAAGGVVNAVTRSGTNVLHGSGFIYYRDERFRARSPFEDPNADKPPFMRRYVGGTVGGPIRKSRAFFFGAYERLDQDQNREATWVLPPATTVFPVRVQQFFDIWGINTSLFGAGGTQRFVTAEPTVAHKATTRLDFELGRGQALVARYALDTSKQSSTKTGTLFDYTNRHTWSRYDDASLGHKWTLGNNRLNELYVAYNRNPFESRNDNDMPVIQVTGAFGTYPELFGGNANYPQSQKANRFQIKDHFMWSIGAHDLKVGGEYRMLRSTATVENFWKGYYIFPGMVFLTTLGFPAALVQQVGNPDIPLNDNIAAAFAQDDWRPTKSLTLSVGVRYDYQVAKLPALGTGIDYGGLLPSNGGADNAISDDRNNLAPRLGFVWSPDDSQAVYGGTGVYYDQVILNNYVSALFTPPYRTIYTITVPPFPAPVTTFPTTAVPNIGYLAEDFRAPWSWNTTLGYRRELTPQLGVDMSVIYNRGEAAQMQINRNPGITGSGTISGTGYVRRVTTVGNANEYNNEGTTRYKAFRVELKRRMHRGFSGGLAYTLAKAEDNAFYMISRIQVPTNPELNWGPSDYDYRHQFVGHVEAELPFGFQAAAILELRSTRPLDITAQAFDVNGDGTTGDWVNEKICVEIACPGFGYSRNSVRSLSTDDANRLRALFGLAPIAAFEDNPKFWNVDATLRKQFTIGAHAVSFVAEVFNLFGAKQYDRPVQDISSDLFGKRTAVFQPRTAQIGVHYRF